MQVFSQVRDELWPAAPIFPIMSPGASDGSFLRNAGIPTYGVGGLTDVTDNRDHGRDERLSVTACYDGHESLYKLVKLLASTAQEPASR
jgi:acetylornithine deacetylase/succinyl-diaminopimelate desuccinylase-like protein